MATSNSVLLAEAEAALHALMTGKAVVRIRHGANEEMEFARADVDKLKAYIATLRGGRITTVRICASKGF